MSDETGTHNTQAEKRAAANPEQPTAAAEGAETTTEPEADANKGDQPSE